MPTVEFPHPRGQRRIIFGENEGAQSVPDELGLGLRRPFGESLESGNDVVLDVDCRLYHTLYMVACGTALIENLGSQEFWAGASEAS
jgi:hypothetical protein